MKGVLPAAALRLSSALPSRTHERKAYVAPPPKTTRPRAVQVRGRQYRNLTVAAKEEKLGYRTIYRMMEKGEAGYL